MTTMRALHTAEELEALRAARGITSFENKHMMPAPVMTKAERKTRAAQSATCFVCGQHAAAGDWTMLATGPAHFECTAA